MEFKIIQGDLLAQNVDAIVNPWNRNIIPWWLLLPQGVSGAIKKRAGTQPFRELAKKGPVPLGGAVATSAGRLPYRAIIHVAGINMLWRASEYSIRQSVIHAVELAERLGLKTVALPLIGSGSGGFRPDKAQALVADTLAGLDSPVHATVVRLKS